MGIFKSKKQPPEPPKAKAEESLNRQDYFRQLRNDFLNRLGLPEGTKPEQVVKILEIKKELDKINKKKYH
ncbi:MAG: hypothetical protein LBO05_07435 [Deltaproteobacteria bacterium]|jgi:hypothetical protein|nr:hypothetical protein [Deltaproteobacteria bacterium]